MLDLLESKQESCTSVAKSMSRLIECCTYVFPFQLTKIYEFKDSFIVYTDILILFLFFQNLSFVKFAKETKLERDAQIVMEIDALICVCKFTLPKKNILLLYLMKTKPVPIMMESSAHITVKRVTISSAPFVFRKNAEMVHLGTRPYHRKSLN